MHGPERGRGTDAGRPRERTDSHRWRGHGGAAPAVDLAQNVFYGHSGTNHVGRVVHRKNDAGHDLNLQTDAAKATKSPKSVQETRRWIVE